MIRKKKKLQLCTELVNRQDGRGREHITKKCTKKVTMALLNILFL